MFKNVIQFATLHWQHFATTFNTNQQPEMSFFGNVLRCQRLSTGSNPRSTAPNTAHEGVLRM